MIDPSMISGLFDQTNNCLFLTNLSIVSLDIVNCKNLKSMPMARNQALSFHILNLRRIAFSIVLNLVSLSLLGQSGKVDSVAMLLKAHTQEDTVRVNLLNELSYQNISVNYYKVREYAEQALRLAENLSYAKGIASANNRLSRASWSLGENNEAIEYALRAKNIIEKEKLGNALLAECYLNLGFSYLDLRELPKAEFYFRA